MTGRSRLSLRDLFCATLARSGKRVSRERTWGATYAPMDSTRMTTVALVVNNDSQCKKPLKAATDTGRSFASTHKCRSSSGLDPHFPANNATPPTHTRVGSVGHTTG